MRIDGHEIAEIPEGLTHLHLEINVRDSEVIVNRNGKVFSLSHWVKPKRKNQTFKQIAVGERAVIDRKSIEWVEKYGHILWVP